MPALSSDLRRQLEAVVIQARDVAEEAARSAIQKRAVDMAEPFAHFGAKEKELRTRLRARGRQVGDVRRADKTQEIDGLTQELAYEFWHRMLFARFLAENHLLMHPDGVAVTLEECADLAPTAVPPAPNGFVLAARYASTMLPQIFPNDDVLLEIDFAPEQRLALEKLLGSLPRLTFLADDSLGWVYQFWQTEEKKRVNKSGNPIDGRTLPAVTQLFTEHYMVQFLLHNTIGAWWCVRHGIKGPQGGAGIPDGESPIEMEYLRWRQDGTPAAGKYDDWPKTLAEFTLLDPCCGSGHFLVAAFNLLVPLRMHDETLSAEKACELVLRDNIFGLELDPRCTQIAAFALALAAWKYPESGGYRSLPPLNIACSGQGVTGKKEEWLVLASGNDRLREGMETLYELFRQAPHLGSLIDPRRKKGDLYEAGYAELMPLLSQALAKNVRDADLTAIGVAAQGIATATEFLRREYTLIITNVPYLGRSDQADVIAEYSETVYDIGKGDIATVFMLRCLRMLAKAGTIGIVTPWNWLFLTTYDDLRQRVLSDRTISLIARLGEKAFESPQAAGAFAALSIIHADAPPSGSLHCGLDVSRCPAPASKAASLITDSLESVPQIQLLGNPSYVISTKALSTFALLGKMASCFQGTSTGDNPRFVAAFWEIASLCDGWERFQVAPEATTLFGGRQNLIRWNAVVEFEGAAIRGEQAWNKVGVAIGQMRGLPATLYCGDKFSNTTPVIIPDDPKQLSVVWQFCTSPEFFQALRDLNPKLSVDNGYVAKIGIDLSKWKAAAEKAGPTPKPYSDDPTQWLFKGDIHSSTDPLQVAVARLLGYHWPEQPKPHDAIEKLSDRDGILCLPSVRGEAVAAERLLEVLHTAFGKNWSNSVLHKLLTDAGCKAGTTLDDWLQSQFFDQHCKMFHSRPFVWHVWDGRKDGFSALVNYHKLDHKTLENLTYSYLGDWMKAQGKSNKAGADLRLGAAQELQEKLKLILAGEPPYDIFVRWKPLHEQAIGWHPDLNDGVRMNIRPFMEAGILRKNPNIKWTKDRGKEPERDKHDFPWFWKGSEFIGDRVNDVHLTNEKKTAARSRKKGAK